MTQDAKKADPTSRSATAPLSDASRSGESTQQPSLPPEINGTTFHTKLVPFMDEQCRNLAEMLKEDEELATRFKSLRLVLVDNGRTENKHYLYVTPDIPDHRFQKDIPDPPAPGIHGGSSPSAYREGYANLAVRGGLRSAITHAILNRARPEHLAKHVERLLRSNYADIAREHTDRFYLFRVRNIEFSSQAFFIWANRLNLVIPIASKLDASEIHDLTADNKKILLTTQPDDSGFTEFDDKLGRIEWHMHFATLAFGDDLSLYKDLIHASTSSVFQAIDFLRATVSTEVYDMKKELALLDKSDGKQFEEYMERFLRACFSPSFDELDLRVQVANRGRINIRDFIISNVGSTDPFLSNLNRQGVELLLFDAKNYAEELTTGDLDSFRRYLADNKKFGDFGVILCRRGVSANCDEHIFRSLLDGTKILVLDEDDLMAMLDCLGLQRNPVEVLKEKYTQLIVQP